MCFLFNIFLQNIVSCYKTASTVSFGIQNEAEPSIETIYEVSKFLKVDIRELLVSTSEK